VREYTCYVVEMVATRKLYTVEADSLDEAKGKLLSGETVSEVDAQTLGVVERQPDWDTVTHREN